MLENLGMHMFSNEQILEFLNWILFVASFPSTCIPFNFLNGQVVQLTNPAPQLMEENLAPDAPINEVSFQDLCFASLLFFSCFFFLFGYELDC